MRTRSGIEMMTVGEIIASLKRFNKDEVMTFNYRQGNGEEKHLVLSSIEKRKEEWNWEDEGKGVVIWKDQFDNEVFRIEHTKNNDPLRGTI